MKVKGYRTIEQYRTNMSHYILRIKSDDIDDRLTSYILIAKYVEVFKGSHWLLNHIQNGYLESTRFL